MKRLLSAAALFATCLGCKPSLRDQPSEFTGNDDLSIGVLCGNDEVGNDEELWVKFAIIHPEGVDVDWTSETLQVQGLAITRRAAGQDVRRPEGHFQRVETYWVKPAASAKPGTTVTVGPYAVRYGRGKGAMQMARSTSCTATVK